MPLNEDAKEFLDANFANELRKIQANRKQLFAQVTRSITHREDIEYFTGQSVLDVQMRFTEQLADSRASSLVAAYERQGDALTKPTIEEILLDIDAALQRESEEFIAKEKADFEGVNSRGKVAIDVEQRLNQERNALANHAAGVRDKIKNELLVKMHEQDKAGSGKHRVSKTDEQWDVFISHAHEDKAAIAKPLANALRAAGLRVWYDEFSLKLGDGLRESIDRGLSKSHYGVVILSPHFFEKHWPKRELDGLTSREVNGGKVILPVWHRVGFEEVREFSPTLADKLAVSTSKGMGAIVNAILNAVETVGGAAKQVIEPAAAVHPVEKPVTPRKPSTFSRARFREADEPIGIAHEPMSQLRGDSPTKIVLADAPAMWLRVMPVSETGRTLKISEIRAKRMELIPPLINSREGTYANVRARDGYGAFPSVPPGEKALSVCFAFVTGEVWTIETRFAMQDFFELNEERFAAILDGSCSILMKLGFEEPFRWIAGIEGVQNRHFFIPGKPHRSRGYCLASVIEKEGTYRPSRKNPRRSLLPLFEEIFDQCGASRPEDEAIAVCCAASNRPGVAHVTNLQGHHPQTVRCASCGKEYSIDYNPPDANRIADFERRLLIAAQTAVDANHPSHGNYVNVTEDDIAEV